MVTSALHTAKASINSLVVVVIDTCGERDSGNKKCFNVDFRDWELITVKPNLHMDKLDGYLAWSLRNVLKRTVPGPNDNYYLNPIGAGQSTCILFTKEKPVNYTDRSGLFYNSLPSSNLLEYLNPLADEYAKLLVPVEETVSKLVANW